MEKEEIQRAVVWLEGLMREFREAKARGKQTNDNAERAQSIADIEETTERLETYIRKNEKLLELITGTKMEVAREVEWSDVVRPTHFEEDLQAEIDKLKKHLS